MDIGSSGKPRARAWVLPVSGLVALVLAGCGDGGVSLPTPSRSLSVSLPSISVSVPSVSVPTGITSPSIVVPDTPTPEPTEEPSETPTETPTRTPTQPPTEPATPTRTATTSVVVTSTVTPTTEVTRTATQTPTPSATPSATVTAAPAPEEGDGGGVPAWLWWVLAALLAALAGWLVVRSRARSAWDGRLAAAEPEVEWLARELLPQLQRAGTPDALAGGWQVSASRVGALEDQLTGLEASAPDEARAARARTLRDAVRSTRSDVESLVATRDQAATPVQLAAATSRLLVALNPAAPAP